MKTFVINLEEAAGRRHSITSQLDKLGMEYSLVQGINGKELQPEEISLYADREELAKHPFWLTPGAIGAALSHMKVYRMIVDEGDEWNLVLEDDVILDRNFRTISENI